MISLCMIVKNEEDNLDKCLKSAEGIADEIIVVDTGSTDSTVEIAKKYTDKVYYFQWIDDFSAARNFSISKAKGDWILILDGDDEVSLKSKDKIRKLTENNSVDVYFFNTLNVMDKNNKERIVINQNPRLFQNKPGYRYEGVVHNQLVSVIQTVNPNMVVKYVPIDIYHYGYLDINIIKQNKRERNMTLLKKQLEKEPDEPFANYNIGNEYFALNNKSKALEHYLIAYNNTVPNIAFFPKLIIRIILCCRELKLYDDIYMYTNFALKYYPKYTDIYYLRGIINYNIGRPTAAVRDLETALELGEPPQILTHFKGAGTYLSLESLYHIYLDFEDYEKCLECSMKLIKYPEKVNLDLLKTIIHCMYKLKIPADNALKFILNIDKEKGFVYASNILITEKDYNLALIYINEGIDYLKSKDMNELLKKDLINNLLYYKGICEFNLKNYKKSIDILMNIDEKKVMYYNLPHIFLAGIIIQDENAVNFSISNNSSSGKVCKALFDILNDTTPKTLTKNEKEYASYENIIFLLLKILLNTGEYEKFKKALSLLDLINSDDTLLRLGKLYYEYGKFKSSSEELFRSIYEKNIIDKKGIKILYNLL